MSYKKIFFLVGFLAITIFIFNFNLFPVRAHTDLAPEVFQARILRLQELFKMIQELQRKIAELRERLAVFSSEPNIMAISPKGGEVWYRGKTYNIKWDTSDIKEGGVIIKLYNYDNLYVPESRVIAPSFPAFIGEYSWEIPPAVPAGYKYKIEIQGSDGLLARSSDYFSIVGDVTSQRCADGTLHGQCSDNEALYCHHGIMVEKCDVCGCPAGERCHLWHGDHYCFISECHTDQDCDDGQEKTINKCELSYEEIDGRGRPKFACVDRLVLRGDVKIAIVEYEAEGTHYPENFIEKLNNQTTRKTPIRPYKDPSSGKEMTQSFFSLYYLENYFEQEAQRYRVDVSVSVDVFGPLSIDELPPFDDHDPAMSNFFTEKDENYGLDLSEYDAVVYLYFTNDVFPFRWQSYAPRTGKNAYIGDGEIHIAGDFRVYQRIVTVAHEIMHKFGAGDRHVGGWGCAYPEGYVEPDRKPLYPQWEGCLMCGSVPVKEKGTRMPIDISEIRVCGKTAEEIGWK